MSDLKFKKPENEIVLIRPLNLNGNIKPKGTRMEVTQQRKKWLEDNGYIKTAQEVLKKVPEKVTKNKHLKNKINKED